MSSRHRLRSRRSQGLFSPTPEISSYLRLVGSRAVRGQGILPELSACQTQKVQSARQFLLSGLAVEGMTAFTRISQEAYTNTRSPLYGTRPVLFIHDEIVVETTLSIAHEAAIEVKKIMEETMQFFTPNIPALAEPALALRWSKSCYPKYDDDGRLVPSDT